MMKGLSVTFNEICFILIVMISSKSYYGITALTYMAINGQRGQVGVKEIAHMHNMPVRFLELIFSRLKSAGLVNSVRGASGGYFLSRSPEKINLGEIILACEGEAEFNVPNAVKDRTLSSDGIGNTVLQIMTSQFHQLQRNLESITLADLTDKSGN